jgi:hypothetical protein
MAAGVPPPPLNSPNGSYYWLEWYTNLTNFLNGTNIPWSNINFSTSNIHDIVDRAHNSLQPIQGGNAAGDAGGSGNAWHMTGRGVVVSGVATGFPTGWTVTNPSGGTYQITHNLGISQPDLGAIATSLTSGEIVQWIDCTNSNYINVHIVNSAGSPVNGDFTVAVLT